ncbi:hypothetical protein QQF64_034141 [Cirrhinus molitorella]|uniref:Uncharacterized protein n=1 Tax=Cirrhinus molitorella TaxID=172907 RepID=A0ABR3MVW0_9TELE
MPLDVRGCAGNPMNPARDRDWGLKLFPTNEEFPVSTGHKPALIKSLPFVHTARRYYRLDGGPSRSDGESCPLSGEPAARFSGDALAAGRTSSEAVLRDRLRFGREGYGGEGGPQRLARPRALQSPPAPTQPLTPGAAFHCLQSAPVRAAPPGRGSGPRQGRPRSAERLATHPTHLETRTKESNARASQRVSSSPHGAMKVIPPPWRGAQHRPVWSPESGAGGARVRAKVPERW